MSSSENGNSLNTGNLGLFGSGSGQGLTGMFTDSGNLYNIGNGTTLGNLGANSDPSGNLLNVGTDGTGPGAGWQNGNLSFMPDNSSDQLAKQAQNALVAGSKIPVADGSQGQMGSPNSKLRLGRASFSSPVAAVGGTAPSSSEVASLINLLKRYVPGSQS